MARLDEATIARRLAGYGIDYADAMGRMGGNAGLYARCARMFLDAAYLDRLEATVAGGEAGPIEDASHKLKGAAGNLAAMRLMGAASEVCEAARTGDVEAAVRMMPQVRAAYEAAVRGFGELLRLQAAAGGVASEAAGGAARGTDGADRAGGFSRAGGPGMGLAPEDGRTRILAVDDEETALISVGELLSKEGFAVDLAPSAERGLEMAGAVRYDLFILDVKMDGMTGFELCRRLRQRTAAPILFLSSLGDEFDKVVGLEAGADDYLAKPFGGRELAARVRALLRRAANSTPHQDALIRAGGLTLDRAAHTVAGNRGEIRLTPTEFELLAALMESAGRVLSHERLQEQVWDMGPEINSNTVATHFKRLRCKMRDAGYDPGLLQTVRGVGYRFRE